METEYYLDMILNSKQIKNKKFKHNTEKKNDKHIKYLYDLLDKSKERISRDMKSRKLVIKKDIFNKESIKIPIGINSYFFPEIIKSFILKNQKKQIVYSFKIKNREIKVYFTLLSEDEITELYDKQIRRMIDWLYICDLYSQNCGKLVEIYIYQSEFKKQLPINYGDVITPENVNSGFSTACSRENEIVIYRKEEWFKVFIHETFHAYGLDIYSSLVDKNQKKIKELFNINNEILMGEIYSEVWARIINILFFCYEKTSNYKDFKLCFIFSLEIERIFGIIQTNKILEHYGLLYMDIINDNKKGENKIKLYRENTNSFCYYILSSLIMQEPYKFLEWCSKLNNQWLKFNNNQYTVDEFINLIDALYKKKSVVNMYSLNDSIKKEDNLNTLRMTLIEINV